MINPIIHTFITTDREGPACMVRILGLQLTKGEFAQKKFTIPRNTSDDITPRMDVFLEMQYHIPARRAVTQNNSLYPLRREFRGRFIKENSTTPERGKCLLMLFTITAEPRSLTIRPSGVLAELYATISMQKLQNLTGIFAKDKAARTQRVRVP